MNYKIIVYKGCKMYLINESTHTAKDAFDFVNEVIKCIGDKPSFYTVGFKFTIMIYLNNKRIKTLVIDRR